MKNLKPKEKKSHRGFTLLVAMIVTALILAIGFSIGNIILKELSLSASGKSSQTAFYAADSIAECALYWDKKDSKGDSVDNSTIVTDSPFATSTPDNPFIQCGTGIPGAAYPGKVENFLKVIDDSSGVQNTSFAYPNTSQYATSSFIAVFKSPEDSNSVSCGEVTIAKKMNKTVIEARGYNVGYSVDPVTGKGGCDISNPRTVERGIKVDY